MVPVPDPLIVVLVEPFGPPNSIVAVIPMVPVATRPPKPTTSGSHSAAPRTELAYGERLRRAKRRTEARAMIRRALDGFERVSSALWSDRARAELAATGERARRRRDPPTALDLTPQELRVALAVAEGASNREAAEALFLSAKTVEFHLGNVYRKLGIRSRSELARRFPGESPARP